MAVTKKSLISSTPKKSATKSSPKTSGPVAAAKLKTAAQISLAKITLAQRPF
jgi:hypothetical protein